MSGAIKNLMNASKATAETGSDQWIQEHKERAVPAGDFYAIDKSMGGEFGQGNISLNNRNIYTYPGTGPNGGIKGDYSSLESITIEDKGKNVLIPKVDASGNMLTAEQAINEYKRTGKYLGKFDSDAKATEYAIALERRQNAYYEKGPGRSILDKAFSK